MNFKKDVKIHLLAPTSMGIRMTPLNRAPVQTSDMFYVHATSAESNVLSIASSLGLNTKILTTFVADSPIAELIKGDLRKRNIAYEGPVVPQGGPWGYRHQINIADSGYGARAPRVTNDRAGEVGRTLNVKDFDLERIFKEDGVALVHISGLIAALSPDTSKFCLEIARFAKRHGTKIAFDLNHRASFWQGREKELHAVFSEIASLSDILIGNEEDYQLALGISGPKAGGHDIKDNIDDFKALISEVEKAYPNASVYATTLRQVLSANEHLWGGLLLENNALTTIEPKPISVLDRIGGGDGFVGGLLYGLLQGFSGEKLLGFAWASGAYVATLFRRLWPAV